MAATTQTQVLQDLSYLLGETTIPTSIADRDDYIQKALERIYRAYNFPMNMVQATFAINNGVGTLPSNVGQDGIIDIRNVVVGAFNDNVYQQVPYQQYDNYQTNDFAYYLLGYEGNYTIYTSETTTSYVATILYTTSVPMINASITTPFPSSMCIALGALKYYRLAEDPYTDVQPYETMYKTELNEVIAAYNRNRAQKRGIGRAEQEGTYTGDITTVGAYVGNAGNE